MYAEIEKSGIEVQDMPCPCPNCGHPKDCGDDLCVLCELKGVVIDKVKAVFKRD